MEYSTLLSKELSKRLMAAEEKGDILKNYVGSAVTLN